MPPTDKDVRPVEVRALDGYRIWLRYDDGVEGEVDLSQKVGRGVFAAWEDRSFFADVRLGLGREIVWGDRIDLCGNALYMEITGLTPEEMFPQWLGAAAA